MKLSLTPAQNGAIKQLLMIILLCITTYLGDASHLTPFVNLGAATFVSMLASSLESHIRATTGNGLFGAARVRQET